jgi:hypothetical protein
MEKTMTSFTGRMEAPDALALDANDAPRVEAMQAIDDDRAELRRALLVRGTAGALGLDGAGSTGFDLRN